MLDRLSRRFCPFRPHITFLPLQTHHCAIRSLGATPVRMSKGSQQSNSSVRGRSFCSDRRQPSRPIAIAVTPRQGRG